MGQGCASGPRREAVAVKFPATFGCQHGSQCHTALDEVLLRGIFFLNYNAFRHRALAFSGDCTVHAKECLNWPVFLYKGDR